MLKQSNKFVFSLIIIQPNGHFGARVVTTEFDYFGNPDFKNVFLDFVATQVFQIALETG